MSLPVHRHATPHPLRAAAEGGPSPAIAPQAPASRTGRSIRRLTLAGYVVCASLVFGFGGWAAVATLSGAVIAPATIVVESNLKKVQHPTGGVIGEINVREGSPVRAGDVVVRLDETVTRANLAVVVKQLDELTGRRARLIAERDGADAIAFPEDLTARAASEDVATILKGEAMVFTARREAREGQKAQLRERVSNLRQEIEALDSQINARASQLRLISEELVGVKDLFQRNLVPITRINPLYREEARLNGEVGALRANIAQSRIRIAETELQIIQIDQDLRAEVLRDLRETEAKIAELAERRIAAQDQLKRIDIRAPQDGLVHQLAVFTVGGVIAPGETLMMIVPQTEALAIEAKVAPQDIDQVFVGRDAFVRMTAFNQRTTPELTGHVSRVSPDATKDQQTGLHYFVARIEVPPEELAKLGSLKLMPGMPAEVHIPTGDRTAMSYFLKPLTDQVARAFKED